MASPSAACVKEMEGWADFKELHLPLEGEEQEDETVVEMEVPLRQFAPSGSYRALS